MRTFTRIFLAILLLLAAGLAFLLLYRPGLPEEQSLRYTRKPDGSPQLVAAWYGTTGVLLSDGETHLFIDPFLSRPGGWGKLLLDQRIAPDENLIGRWLLQAGVRRLDAVLVSHSHFDHAMDAGVMARMTGAVLLGSASTMNIGRGAGLPAAQLDEVESGAALPFGKFRVRFIASKHAGATGGAPTGDITAPLAPPARYSDYRQGGTYSILVEHPLCNVLFHGSAGFVPHALDGLHADVVFLGIAIRGDLSEYLKNVVDAVGAKRVIPTHWDDFTRPLDQPLLPMPAGVNLAGFFRDLRALRPDLTVQTLAPAEPVALLP